VRFQTTSSCLYIARKTFFSCFFVVSTSSVSFIACEQVIKLFRRKCCIFQVVACFADVLTRMSQQCNSILSLCGCSSRRIIAEEAESRDSRDVTIYLSMCPRCIRSGRSATTASGSLPIDIVDLEEGIVMSYLLGCSFRSDRVYDFTCLIDPAAKFRIVSRRSVIN